MLDTKFLEDLSIKIRDITKSSPVGDLQENVRALLQGAFTKLELVPREEFDVQAHLLRDSRQKLDDVQNRILELEKNITALELALQKNNK